MFMCLHATQSILRDAQEELRVQWSSFSQPNINKAFPPGYTFRMDTQHL